MTFDVVWNGGPLLPPRASTGWPFEGEADEPRQPPPETWTPERWKERGFRVRVFALLQVGYTQRQVATRLKVSRRQVQQAVAGKSWG